MMASNGVVGIRVFAFHLRSDSRRIARAARGYTDKNPNCSPRDSAHLEQKLENLQLDSRATQQRLSIKPSVGRGLISFLLLGHSSLLRVIAEVCLL
jgi:hypothetical protein